MIGALVVTHGQLGQELVAAAEMIVGEISHIRAISIGWHDDVNEAQKDIERRIGELDNGKGVLLLTDMFGGTPSNIAFALYEPGKIDIVTGVNLPMIIKIVNQKESDTLDSLARIVRDQGRKSIAMAGDFLDA
ncbi:MAG: PTS sugar transporter subunit IIA [Acidobacteriota bacterium]|jgi:PTS system mannose-specific IIA component|nr:PTS sugar transporter subunit IIA [Acidobacteriota bacterium]NLT33909.1 PTS sugar transporter subunit IIA [Acidobacteriota bacterium]